MARGPAGGSWPGSWPGVVMGVRPEVGSMGRPVIYRQRVQGRAASVQAKSLLAYIGSEIRARREVSVEEGRLIALDAYRFLEGAP